jgi:hypothetical protein
MPRQASGTGRQRFRGSHDGKVVEAFTAALDEDLNVWSPGACGLRMGARIKPFAGRPTAFADAPLPRVGWERMDSVFGLSAKGKSRRAEVLALLSNVKPRARPRISSAPHSVRDGTESQGWLIGDTPKGPRLRPA